MTNFNRKGFVITKFGNSLSQIISDVKKNENFNEAGDIITFSGVVRTLSSVSSKKVVKIEIQAYEEKANEQLDNICFELINKYNLIDARIVHYIGIFEVGDTLVNCVVASRHRNEGFEALKEIIDAYKSRAYLFKCEIYEDGTESWISDNQSKIHSHDKNRI